MPTNCLRDTDCRGAKPSEKLYKLFDGGGLYLAILPSGAKAWRAAYRFGGKQQTKSFGPYPEVSLAGAREELAKLKADLRAGVDPMGTRKAARALRARPAMTLGRANEAFWAGRGDVSPSYRVNAERGISLHLANLIDRDVSSIGRADLLAELMRMNASGLFVYVRKVRMWVGQVFDWCIEHEYMEINPSKLIDPKKAFGRAPVESFAALELREVPAFLQRLGAEPELQSVHACRMLMLTWVRTVELRLMEWSEIDDVEATWLIPAGKMKRKKDLLVPLSRQAVAILKEMRARTRGDRYVFPSDRTDTRPMSENAVLYLIHRIGYKGRLTGHGFRSIGSTWANERGYSPDAIERQLAHVPDSKVRAVYNRAQYLPERRKMLQEFADWVDGCRSV